MSKLSYENKINLYNDKKAGLSVNSISKKYSIRASGVNYLFKLIDIHGYDVLRTNKNKDYAKYEKQEAINRVLINNEPIWTVALDIGLPSDGLLSAWISKYKENGYNIVEWKRGRCPTIMKKPKVSNKTETIEEEVERLKKENLYLKAKLEYSKKLRAAVQVRKNQQQKKR